MKHTYAIEDNEILLEIEGLRQLDNGTFALRGGDVK